MQVRNASSQLQPQQMKVFSRDPPTFKHDKQFRRVVRIEVGPTNNTITYADLFTIERGYYGIAESRWRNVRVLGFTAYGYAPGTRTTPNGDSALQIDAPTEGNQLARATYSDHGSGSQRAVVKVRYPPQYVIRQAADGTAVVGFTPNTVQLIDFYCEFS